MTEYTLDEQIAALRKLGAQPQGDDPNYSDGRIVVECEYFGQVFDDVEDAHYFLRTDRYGWMAMDEVLKKSCLWRRLAGYVMGEVDIYDYQVITRLGKHFQSGGEDRQTAVYDCYMQFIREELKKK